MQAITRSRNATYLCIASIAVILTARVAAQDIIIRDSAGVRKAYYADMPGRWLRVTDGRVGDALDGLHSRRAYELYTNTIVRRLSGVPDSGVAWAQNFGCPVCGSPLVRCGDGKVALPQDCPRFQPPGNYIITRAGDRFVACGRCGVVYSDNRISPGHASRGRGTIYRAP